MSAFSNFAMSFSVICILAGGLTSLHLGLSSVGGASIGIGWPFACMFSVCTALAMGQIASAFPTAGGLYHWASILGGRGWGWLTAWFNLAGLITVLSAINVGIYTFAVGSLGPIWGFESDPNTQVVVVMLITLSQALLNHLGIRITSFLIDISGYLIMAVTLVLVASLIYYSAGHDFSRLFTFTNFSGEAGGRVWPVEPNMLILFLLGLQLPAYTITGFDASAHTAEETRGASLAVPKAIVFAVVSSSIFGWIMLSCIVMAIPDLRAGIHQGDQVFFFTMGKVLPQALCALLYLGCGLAQYLCGLATVTSSSRMVYAFARDGGLPLSSQLRQVDSRYLTPVKAIWTVALLSVGFASYSKVYSTIAVVCTIFLYISYVIPITLGLYAYRRSWTKMGPWDLGPFFRVAATVAAIGCSGLILIGVQPPNELALYLIFGFLLITGFIWQIFEKHRFQGPPVVGMELS
ncbi:MAG: amino acid permease [Candidatus Eremiobacteraeota bacterium]|nr:amino acid permease [Candidatus Eremiobacteraeota bacterium]MCW5869734.1 amino acid permease [Candidatus Eremiobacteraeota bacterium]